MGLLILLLGASFGWTQTVMTAPSETAVYKAPNESAHVLFYLRQGEKADVTSVNEDYFKARVKRSGHTYTGYILKVDLHSEFEFEGESADSPRTWSLGVSAAGAYDVQSAKSFEGTDQVQHQTTNLTSTTPRVDFSLQTGTLDFWRLTAGAQATNYSATARTSVIGSQAQSLKVAQTLISASLRKGWKFFSAKHLYWGLGAEVAKVVAVSISLDGTSVPTTSSDQPFYIDGIAFMGGDWSLSERWFIFSELQLSVVGDESPIIYGAAARVGLRYAL